MKKLTLAILSLLFAQSLLAINPVPYTLGVSFSFRLAGTGTGLMTVYDEVGAPALSLSTSGTTTESGISLSWMKPGREYSVNFQGSGASEYWLSFICPAGYQLWVDGFPTDLIDYVPGSTYNTTRTLVLRPIGGGRRMDAGTFSGIQIGKSISWDVGVGGIRSGHGMDLVSFREQDLSNSPSSRDRLLFTPLTGTWQCNIVRDGALGQTVRQIAGPQTVADFVDDGSGGYWIKFYQPSQATWSPPVYTFSGSPWKTIHVESPAANQLKITETEGSVSRVSNLTAAAAATLATGGTVTTNGGYTIHTFTTNGTFTVNSGLSAVEALVVAGGGGGGAGVTGVMNAGGGGGGGLLYNSAFSVSPTSYSITVGAGGATGNNGANSSFSSMTAIGGGHGASGAYAAAGASGGSGGGEGTSQGGGAGAGTSGQGYAGAAGTGAAYYSGGGGGGAGGAATSINGAAGTSYWISGSYTAYAGGGGGGTNNSFGGTGGVGGGGTGGGASYYWGLNGLANTGGGGGGASQWSSTGGTGGSGVVIMRYPTPGGISSGNFGWTLQEGDGSSWARTTTHTSTQYSGYREDIVVVRTGGTSGTIVGKTKYRYENLGWGDEVTQVVADPDTAALTTTYVYNTSTSYPGNYRKVQSVTDPTGNWTAYTYYDDWNRRGRVQYEYHPYNDAPATASLVTTTGRVVSYDYVADRTGRYTRPSLRQEKVNNVMTGQMSWSWDNSSNSPYWDREKANIASYRDASNYQTDRTETITTASTEEGGEPALAYGADQTKTVWNRLGGDYVSGTFTPNVVGVNWRELVIHGTTNSSGATSESSYDSQPFDAIYVLPNRSTMDVTYRDIAGNIIRKELHVYTGSSTWPLVNYTDYTYDFAGRLTQSVESNGATTSYTYTNGLLTSTTDFGGRETQFTYDALWRTATSVQVCPSGSGYYVPGSNITTTYTYDGANNVTQTVVAGSSLSLTSTAQFDLADRCSQTVAPGSYTTGIAYSSGGKIVTTTLPGGTTKVSETYLDGQLKSVSGTGVVAESYTPFIDSGTGKKASQAYFGGNASAVVNSYWDWLGHKTDEWTPQWGGSYHAKLWYYNNNNQLYKFSQPGMADTLYAYDTLGVAVMQGLDINGNGSMDPASNDRIQQMDWGYYTWDGGVSWWNLVEHYAYATNGSGSTTFVGYTNKCIKNPSGYYGLEYDLDVNSNYVYKYSAFARSSKLTADYVYYPGSSVTTYQSYCNGFLVASLDKNNLTTSYHYDGLGRQNAVIDPRTGTITTAYVSGTNQILSVTDASSVAQATYTYDGAGRVASVTNGLSKTSNYTYTARGEKYRVWGNTDYPVEYAYDGSGHMTTMSTFRSGSGWTNTYLAGWPSATTGTADTTTWAYDTSTNLLTSKTDAASKAVNYTYTAAHQVLTRAWARYVSGTSGPKLTATYSYSSTTGELTGVSYNDSSTPSLAYTYNRLGKTATVVDYAGTRTFNYNLGGTLELSSEDLPTLYGPHRLTYGYDTTTTNIHGRPISMGLYNTAASTYDQSTTYGYDSYNRVNSVAGGGRTFNYGYVANSPNLIATVTDSALGYTDTRTYNATHDWISDRTTTIGSTTKAVFAYTPDNIGRTTKITKTGEIFNRYGNGTQGLDTSYTYDDLSQVKTDQTKLGGSSTVLTGRDDAYNYDTIGNRSSSAGMTHNSHAANYTTNALNQYTQRDVPGFFDVAGAASTGATVTVNGSSSGVTRHGQYFFDGFGVTNTTNPVYTTLSVSDGTTTTSLPAYVAKTAEAFTHDDDGNLTGDGHWTFAYDAENRIIWMQTTSAAVTAGAPLQGFTYCYDYLGRRVLKVVYLWSGGNWVYQSQERYVYDGWNMVAILDGSCVYTKGFIWGMDLAGPGQTTGGVGALLMIKDGSNSYLTVYDGNGNVSGLLTAGSVTLNGHSYSAGDTVAAYEYDAFGQTLRESGDYAASNSFRFSTKFTDLETGLVYYGMRYYSPSQGRFITKDPIEEQGGLNLYAFCCNSGVSRVDRLGCFELSGLFDRVGADLKKKSVISVYVGFAFTAGLKLGGEYDPGFLHGEANLGISVNFKTFFDNPLNSIVFSANSTGMATRGGGGFALNAGPGISAGLSNELPNTFAQNLFSDNPHLADREVISHSELDMGFFEGGSLDYNSGSASYGRGIKIFDDLGMALGGVVNEPTNSATISFSPQDALNGARGMIVPTVDAPPLEKVNVKEKRIPEKSGGDLQGAIDFFNMYNGARNAIRENLDRMGGESGSWQVFSGTALISKMSAAQGDQDQQADIEAMMAMYSPARADK